MAWIKRDSFFDRFFFSLFSMKNKKNKNEKPWSNWLDNFISVSDLFIFSYMTFLIAANNVWKYQKKKSKCFFLFIMFTFIYSILIHKTIFIYLFIMHMLKRISIGFVSVYLYITISLFKFFLFAFESNYKILNISIKYIEVVYMVA